MAKRTDIKKILIIGSGPIVIGQAAEFDYAGTQACLALKEEGYEVVLCNSNPATIMTDTIIADKVYMEPLTLEYIAKIIRYERPDALTANYANTIIAASGSDVGLPEGQMGNSEVGHTNIGAGRIVYQELTRITKAIKDGDFFKNEVLCSAVDKAVKAGKAVHIMGLMSPGGVHSHEDHIAAMIKLAAERGAQQIYLHGFLDGRDVAPRSAQSSIDRFDKLFAALGKGRIASMVGRYFAMVSSAKDGAVMKL